MMQPPCFLPLLVLVFTALLAFAQPTSYTTSWEDSIRPKLYCPIPPQRLESNVPPTPVNQDDLAQLKLYAGFVSVASCTNLRPWSCEPCRSPDLKNTHVTLQIDNPATDAQGYVAVNKRLRIIILAFRGTTDIEGWLNNLHFQLTEYPQAGYGAAVHSGFKTVYQSVREIVLQEMARQMREKPEYEVILSGHSLGAAGAVLTAIDLAKLMPQKHFTVYTYGEPRIGNTVFAAYVDSLANVNVKRFVNGHDIVPHLPPSWWGYTHEGVEYWSPQANENAVVCRAGIGEEDNMCIWSLDSHSYALTDHLFALGVKLGRDVVCEPTSGVEKE